MAVFGQAWAWEKAQSDATIVAKRVMKLVRAAIQGTSAGTSRGPLDGIDVRGIAAWFSSLQPEGKQRIVECLLWDGGAFAGQLKPGALLRVLDEIGGTSGRTSDHHNAGIQCHCERIAQSSRRIEEFVRKIIQSEGCAAGSHPVLRHSPWHWLVAGRISSEDLGSEDAAAVAIKLERLAEAASDNSSSGQLDGTVCREDLL